MLHRVNRLQFEAMCSTDAQAFEVRNSFAHKQGEISDLIDKVCSRYVSEDELIQIDRIEVDLGNFNIQVFEQAFSTSLLSKFEQAFSNRISSIPVADKRSSKQSSNVEILIHFLQTGTVPWWADDDTLNINAVFMDLHEQQNKLLYNFLHQHRFSATVWQRIALQFDQEVNSHIISFFPELTIAENKVMQWSHVISGQRDDNNYKTDLPGSLVKQQHTFILFHAPVFFNTANENNAMGRLIDEYANEFTAKIAATISPVKAAEKIIAYEKEAGDDKRSELIIDKEVKKEAEAAGIIKIDIVHPEKFTVHTAGAVLLAPYFKQLFTHMDLLEQGEWKNREAQYKAIHLIRFLVTGEQMCPEHSLVMEKLLCGIEISATIPREIELSETEMAEATDLLQAVISNWARLKNTSVEGLRETFLKRDGILSKKENSWLLQVERRTVDVLLESIPWSYTTLAFTWNSYIIFTEW